MKAKLILELEADFNITDPVMQSDGLLRMTLEDIFEQHPERLKIVKVEKENDKLSKD